MPDGCDGAAELAVDAAAVVELLVGWTWWALVLYAADATDSHNENDEHQDEGNAQSPDDDVEWMPWHVGEALSHATGLPLQIWRHKRAKGGTWEVVFGRGTEGIALLP